MKSDNIKYFNNENLNELFIDYLDMRKKIKKPATDRAIKIAIKRLYELSKGNTDIAERILENSILNCWQGIFPLNDKDNNSRLFDYYEMCEMVKERGQDVWNEYEKIKENGKTYWKKIK